jgi:hypothetical protein
MAYLSCRYCHARTSLAMTLYYCVLVGTKRKNPSLRSRWEGIAPAAAFNLLDVR